MVLGKNNHNSPTEEISAMQEGDEEKCLKCVEGEEGCEYKCVQGASSYIRIIVRWLYRVWFLLQKQLRE